MHIFIVFYYTKADRYIFTLSNEFTVKKGNTYTTSSSSSVMKFVSVYLFYFSITLYYYLYLRSLLMRWPLLMRQSVDTKHGEYYLKRICSNKIQTLCILPRIPINCNIVGISHVFHKIFEFVIWISDVKYTWW